MKCPNCEGHKTVYDDDRTCVVTCPGCDGTGVIEEE